MKLIVGLGNPGKKYQFTRHNLGFMAVDYFVMKEKLDSFRSGFQGEYIKTTINNEETIIYKPFTYMNLSGIGVKEIKDYYKIDDEDVLVIYDDKDLPFSFLRLREKGNAGSHKGMINIVEQLSTTNFKRIRIGIGSPIDSSMMIDFVLTKFSKEELTVLSSSFENVHQALLLFIDNKFNIAMNKYNSGKNNDQEQ